ncbi:helix-turn-helix transcriptional regulator [Hydrogenoanaerobacterium sp.]|uniref:helix-turn-helix domain-containing protein n=1 Tax=Hydrogenoanaerobacterium sp. TaxID=2953763 RepID=UPI00289DCB91|nr:helix-turn-helix transcriptional regulator [Hydrogenoanaerobacterium sp.]
MYKNRATDGRNNICGKNIAKIRKSLNPKVSQRMLADQLQRQGLDIDKNAIQRIESGERFVTDIELIALAAVLKVSLEALTDCTSGL